jgi:hypothetical protein
MNETLHKSWLNHVNVRAVIFDTALREGQWINLNGILLACPTLRSDVLELWPKAEVAQSTAARQAEAPAVGH